MIRLISLLFLFSFSNLIWAQETVFTGRIDLGRTLASLEKQPPQKGTLYLLSGAAATVRIRSEDPFAADVEFVEGEWVDESTLISHRTVLHFEGAQWADLVVEKKPRQDFESVIYPYRKFQVAALASGEGFRVVAVTSLY